MKTTANAQTYRTGQTAELHTPAHPYRHMGFTDPGYIIPEQIERLRITRVTRGGDRLTLRRPDNTGFAIVVSQWLAHYGRTIRIVEG